jgi:hypothetical protein
MSNDWDEMHEELPADNENTQEGFKKLRQAYDRKTKAEKELKDQLAALQSRERERTLSETLSAKGVNPKLASLYPASRESTPEKVDEWLTEYADAFGQAPPRQAPAEPQVSPELQAMYQQFQQPGMNTPVQDDVSAIKNYQFGDPGNSEQELQKFMSFMRNNPGAVQNPGAY